MMEMCDTLTSTLPRPPLAAYAERAPAHYFFTANEPLGREMLALPYQHFIETRTYAGFLSPLNFIRDEEPDFSLSLTTETAFRQPVADLLSAHFQRMCGLSGTRESDVRSCLQEAIMNSIIHGNLAIQHRDDSIRHFQEYLDRISSTIDRGARGLQRVSVHAWVSLTRLTVAVTDEGKGFSLQQPKRANTSPYGRGLPLIRAMSHRMWQMRPNHLYMQFLLD